MFINMLYSGKYVNGLLLHFTSFQYINLLYSFYILFYILGLGFIIYNVNRANDTLRQEGFKPWAASTRGCESER